MNREERVRILIDYLKKENTGYASLADPVDYTGRRRLLRSLMNVRWPGEADPEYTRIQDEPVSYTHLDVYKRQELADLHEVAAWIRKENKK